MTFKIHFCNSAVIWQTQRLLEHGDTEQKRSWFQEHEERLLVKKSQTLGAEKSVIAGFKEKKGKPKSKTQRKRDLTVIKWWCDCCYQPLWDREEVQTVTE